MTAPYSETRVRQSELLQLLLLDGLYSLSGSRDIVFQGGTALRWIYGGPRFSEDLDFVTQLSADQIRSILETLIPKFTRVCIAQFGSGQFEQQIKASRPTAFKTFFVYRPSVQRERIAVKLEFEFLQPGKSPDFQKRVFRDIPQISRLITAGQLFMPYSGTILLAETPEEILTDKIRALYERQYLKGRDVFDIWWLSRQLGVSVRRQVLEKKLTMYQAPFVAKRDAGFFHTAESVPEIKRALQSDLVRFIPHDILAAYQADGFRPFIQSLEDISWILQEWNLFQNPGK